MGPIQSIEEFQNWLRRRAPLIALCVVLGAVAGVVAATRSQHVYSATAVLQIINPVISDEGRTLGAASAVRRAQAIEQRLMTRENMLALVERHGLFQDLPLTQTELVTAMRASVRLESVAAAQGGGTLSAINISANLGDPDTAAAVANDLAESLVAQSTADARRRIERALEFFRQEESRIQQQINELEGRITTFQTENESMLPSATAIRRDELGRLEQGLLQINRELSQLRAERSQLQDDAGRAVSRRRIAELDDQIAQRAAEEVLVAERVAYLESLMQGAPSVERELGSLQRQMESLQTQLAAASQQRREAEVGQRIELEQQSEQFIILESATPPDYSISRSRRMIAMMGVIAGLMGGLGFAFLVEALQPVLRTADRMERELQLRPAISIPMELSPLERRRRRLIWGFGILMLALAAGALVVQLAAG